MTSYNFHYKKATGLINENSSITSQNPSLNTKTPNHNHQTIGTFLSC